MNCRYYLVMALLSGLMLCTRPLETTGVTETGTVVTGNLVTTSGTPVSASLVKLVPADFDPLKDAQRVRTYADTTDSAGSYAFHAVPLGAYTVLSVNIRERTRAMTGGVNVDAGEDTVAAPVDTLRIPGAIKMTVSDIFDTTNGYVYIPGTFNFVRLRGAGHIVVLDSVPAGTIASVACNSSSGSDRPRSVRYDVSVPSGDTAVVSNTAWQFSKTIVLNTSASGASVAGNVYKFPVLVRLTSMNFIFNDAKGNGDDLRFTKQDNTPLAYEVQRWDAANEQAEVWVKADTIFGNNGEQAIVMYWGNPNASAGSNSAAVFDTAGGFQGVWHLDGASGDIEKDATVHRYDATPYGKTLPKDTIGVIGTAIKFDGISNYFDMKGTAGGAVNFLEKSRYTLSAWVDVDTLDSSFQALVYKGTYQYGLQIRPENAWEFNEYKDSSWWEGVKFTAVAHTWKYVVGARSGAQEFLYVDGQLVSNTLIFTTRQFGIVARNTSLDLQLAHSADGDEGGRFFKGALDEVCVAGVSRSADWIKLCYMNQRPDDKLVVFKK
jgi:hypothetical protein